MAKELRIVALVTSGYMIPADKATNDYIAMELEEGEEYVVTVKKKSTEVTRSVKLNAARWVWCSLVASFLNTQNYMRRHFYTYVVKRGGGEAPWTKDSVSELMWKPTQEAITGHSTSKLPTGKEYGQIHVELDNQLMTMTKLTMPPWPSNSPPLTNDYD